MAFIVLLWRYNIACKETYTEATTRPKKCLLLSDQYTGSAHNSQV